jgi:hypothetical protein
MAEEQTFPTNVTLIAVEGIRQRLSAIEGRLAEFADFRGFIVPITTFAPLAYECIRDIPVAVKKVDEEQFIATFYDAGISASGDTDSEAIENLKDQIVSTFELFASKKPEVLGPFPSRQLAVLRTVIRRGAEWRES